jgi:dual-specificity kinase
MSTPTTAVATLPPFNAHQNHYNPSYTHSHHHQPHQAHHNSNGNYRSPVSGYILPPAPAASSPSTRLLGTSYYQQTTTPYSPIDGVAQPAVSRPRLPPPHTSAASASSPYEPTPDSRHHEHNLYKPQTQEQPSEDDSFSSTMTRGRPSDSYQSSKKRRRSGEPNWGKFYANGLPKEVIVIDDTPEPEANIGRKVSGTKAAPAATNGASQANKRRRKEDETGASRPSYHVQYVEHNDLSQYNTTPSGTTASSSARTNSDSRTTAPTSLSSNGHDDVQLPEKRKRTTRQQVANEAKRRDIDGLGDRLFTYKPPPYPPKKASDVPVRVVHEQRYGRNVKIDDEDGHYIVVPDAELTDKYKIVRLLGQGTFGKVVQARDRRTNKAVAIKIIRSVQKYRDASKIELRVLATLKANDEENRNRCIHLRDCFDYRGHICIVMDLLSQSVFDFLKGNNFVPFPNSQIQNFARQLLTSVAFLHDLNLVHTDLKPENILLCNSTYQTFTYNRKIPSSSTGTSRQATQRRVLLDTEIQLIDFGSATFQDEYHSSVVSTRHYRAPEIIMGLGWSFPCDIWSIGCILVEFFTGDALFQTHDNLEHLAMMEAVVGTRIDSHLVQAVNKMTTRSGGNPASKYFKRLKLDYPTVETTRGSRKFVKAMRLLEEIIPSNTQFLKNFLDLLKKMFVYDPSQRITAKQALNHPFFKEMAHPDDGTEAAKIRKEKMRREQERL